MIAPSGMPDFNQYQFGIRAACGPTAIGNCLWWFGAVPQGWTPKPMLIQTLGTQYLGTDPNFGTMVHNIEPGVESYFAQHNFQYYATTFKAPFFHEMEESLKVSQDIILLYGFWWQDRFGYWWRAGGHYVTMAGVCSESLQIAISDPARDAAETGWPGRVRPPYLPHPSDSLLHNDPSFVSQDKFVCWDTFPNSGNPGWIVANDPDFDILRINQFYQQNVPPEFQQFTQPWDGQSLWYTVVEYAIMICPIRPQCNPLGDVNQDQIIDIGDIVSLINYVFYGEPPPAPDLSCGDVNCDGVVDIGDIVFLISYVFYGGSPPPASC